MTVHAASSAWQRAVAKHPRQWRQFRYVYPVISRRSRGLSIGVNLNPDKRCDFRCIYCCVDRNTAAAGGSLDLHELRAELDQMLDLVQTGALWEDPAFRDLPEDARRWRDLAFSGDGEPTLCPHFPEAVDLVADVRRQRSADDVKLVLFTNATALDRPQVRTALRVLDANNGEVWAKLDAGSERYYRTVNRSAIPLSRILENILACGRERSIVIQTLLMRVNGVPMPDAEFDTYVRGLEWLLGCGCRIRLVQLYTVARDVFDPAVTPLDDKLLHRRAAELRARLPMLAVESFGSTGTDA